MSTRVYEKASSFLPTDPVISYLIKGACNHKQYTQEEINEQVKFLAAVVAETKFDNVDEVNRTELAAVVAVVYNQRATYDLIQRDVSLSWEVIDGYLCRAIKLKNEYSYSELSRIVYYAAAGGNEALVDQIIELKPELLGKAILGCRKWNSHSHYLTRLEERLLTPRELVAGRYPSVKISDISTLVWITLLFVLYLLK